MNLDLSKYYCDEFSFFTEIEISETLFNELKSIYPKADQSQEYIVFSTTYKIKPIDYAIDLSIIQTGKNKYDFYLEYKTEAPDFSKETKSISNLLIFLSKSIDKELIFVSSGTFSYPNKKFVNVFELPFKLERPGVFDEIKGIRGYKYEDGKRLYDIIIDLLEKNLYVSLNFSYTNPFSKELPKLILKEAQKVSLKVVKEKVKHAKKTSRTA